MGYEMAMIEFRRTVEFAAFLADLRDERARAKIAVRLTRLASGNEGDVKPVGEGLSELRINYGPGYRIYFKRRGMSLILLLCAGEKQTQDKDIRLAKRLALEMEL